MTVDMTGVAVDLAAVVGTEEQEVSQFDAAAGRFVRRTVQVPVTLGRLLERQAERTRREAAAVEAGRRATGLGILGR